MKLACALVIALILPVWVVRADEVTPVQTGKPAPFTGLLVPEDRFVQFLEAEAKLDGAQRELEQQKKYSSDLDAMYRKQLEEAVKPEPWYMDPRLHASIGFIIGVATTTLAVYGGVKIVEATGNGH